MSSELSIDHVSIAVTDLDESVNWYRENLGFEEVERRLTEGENTAMISAVMKSGSAVVVLVQGTSPQSQVSKFIAKFGPGVQHIAFSVTDLDGALGRLAQGSGAPETDVIEGAGIRQVFLRRDPGSGVRVELIERRGGDFNERSIAKLFQAFEDQDIY
jgi:methylmalonyl-CoA/ethylmalonyl-CoA epimerase